MDRFETPPCASLNRVQIIDLPGLPLDDSVRGQRGDDLVSNRALMAYAGELAGALGLASGDLPLVTPQLTLSDVRLRDRLSRVVGEALESDDPTRRAAAESIARRLGRNLGWLLITLHRGDAANRAVRPDWQEADWDKWAAVRQVWLGGGLSSGRLGEVIADEARCFVTEFGYEQIEIALSHFRGLIALVGAARTVNTCERRVLGFDFGHTLVKRAVLTYRDGALWHVESLPPRLADWRAIYPPDDDEAALGRSVLAFMTGVIYETALEAPQAEPLAVVSVAAYKQQGRLIGNGPYASIHTAAGDGWADSILTAAISERAGHAFAVRAIHDGTAAALAHAGSPNAAVIVMGTALGVGFPPDRQDGLCPVAPDFSDSLIGPELFCWGNRGILVMNDTSRKQQKETPHVRQSS